MNLEEDIFRVFGGSAFSRPLFYSFQGGLRFNLSDGGSEIERFMLALERASAICARIFNKSSLVVCLSVEIREGESSIEDFSHELELMGIEIPPLHSAWLSSTTNSADADSKFDVRHIAFEAPISAINSFLWCALASDLPSIRPRVLCDVRLFDLAAGILAFPYDDRGIDVVGHDHHLLADLYTKFSNYLSAFDIDEMKRTFD